MKIKYRSPDLEIIKFNFEDIVASSYKGCDENDCDEYFGGTGSSTETDKQGQDQS